MNNYRWKLKVNWDESEHPRDEDGKFVDKDKVQFPDTPIRVFMGGKDVTKDYDPNQPRVPGGLPEGGRWTSREGNTPDFSNEEIDVYLSGTNEKLPDDVIGADEAAILLSPEGKLSVGISKVAGAEPDHALMIELMEGTAKRIDDFTRARVFDGKVRAATLFSGLGKHAILRDRYEADMIAYNKMQKLARSMLRAGYPSDFPLKWQGLRSSILDYSLEDWKMKEKKDRRW